jgi:DNA-binding MarR family transcriptional regulator
VASQSTVGRLPVGQLLGNLMRLFRAELADRGESSTGVDGIRPAHLQVFAVIKAGGTRLTDLAAWADMSLSAMAELVDSLEQLGYVERRPDPRDGRAKLVCLTDNGWRAMQEGRRLIAQIEGDWGAALGSDRFESLCREMQALLDLLDSTIRERYVPGSAVERSAGASAPHPTRR